jgi:hypothetical protein
MIAHHGVTTSRIAFIAIAAVALTTVQSNAAPSTLPIFPGATKTRVQARSTYMMCGHKVSIVSYRSGTGAKTVAKWYQQKIRDAAMVDLSQADSVTVDTEIEVFAPDGSQAAVQFFIPGGKFGPPPRNERRHCIGQRC